MNLETIIRELYESEIFVELETSYGVGKVRMEKEGHASVQAWFKPNEDSVSDWLIKYAIQLYPESEFARKHETQHRD